MQGDQLTNPASQQSGTWTWDCRIAGLTQWPLGHAASLKPKQESNLFDQHKDLLNQMHHNYNKIFLILWIKHIWDIPKVFCAKWKKCVEMDMYYAILHRNDHTVLSHCPISAEDRAPTSHLDEIILLQLWLLVVTKQSMTCKWRFKLRCLWQFSTKFHMKIFLNWWIDTRQTILLRLPETIKKHNICLKSNLHVRVDSMYFIVLFPLHQTFLNPVYNVWCKQ